MKKTIIILGLIFSVMTAYGQAGDLTVSARGAYVSMYPAFTYGLDVSYQISDPLEASISGMMNPKITKEDKDFHDPAYTRRYSLYTGSLDVRFLLLRMENWSTGPSIGAQLLSFESKDNNHYVVDNGTALGVNFGWHLRINVTDNLRLTGGWRYTNTKESVGLSHHAFYLGIGYAFNLF
ncbi:MAG: porin family protein [Candidatus Azobacteroides sp.]|nr:porin family protein [Candidatus Azobacteroides sp.]